ncbi:Uncharacterized protein APZ42_005857 [Daphnia magna]|uniref:Uncharacterized protein n=1 Tax=Daphnia magna TaxID=35525 RepID=A0A162CSN0_9CRUS|nr:Uncharacterized protein APZ42_005857 [Daphnia magna]
MGNVFHMYFTFFLLSSRLPQMFGLKTKVSLSEACVGDMKSQQSTCHLPTILHMEKECAEEIEVHIDLHQNTAGAESSNIQTMLNHLQGSNGYLEEYI